MRSTMLVRLNLARVDYLRQAEELAHFAQSTELELRGNKAMGRDVVNNIGETHKEKRKCYKCGEIGHLKATCPQLDRTDSVDFALTVGESHLGNSSDSWILDSGSSRHLVNDSSLLEDAEDFASECYVADGKALRITKRGSVVLHVKAMGEDRTVWLLDVQFAADLERNIISYGKLERKGYALTYRDGRRVLAPKQGGQPFMDVDMTNSVLVVRVGALRVQESARDVIMAVLAEREELPDPDVQQGSLMHFHRRFGHLHYDTILRMAKIQASGIVLTDEKRENCLACAQGKQTKNRQSKKDTGRNSPVDVVGGVICSDLKGPMTPRDRLGNRYMVNFIDHRTNYCRVFLAKTKDAAALKFQQFLTFFERQFNCTVRVLRTDGGGEYQTLDLFCKSTGVARQVSEARNQASNGKAERMHRTIMNMVRSMVFACGLPLSFWGDAAEYAAFVLNRSPSKSNPGRQSPLQMLTRSMPDLGEIVAFGSPCTVHRDPSNKSLGERGKPGLIIGKSEETKGYRVYIPKDQVVIVTQHVANIETLSASQNEQLRRVHLGTDDQGDKQTQHPERTEVTHSESDTSEHTASETLASKRARHRGGRVREKHQTRSATRKAAEAAKEQPQGADVQEEPAAGVVNAVREPDPKNYGQAMRSERKSEWELAMAAELEALELNGVWAVVVPPNGSHLLHTKWVFKTKTEADGAIERFKARLVACGNEQLYGVDYGVTFAAVMELSTVKVILVLARRWRVPSKHGDIPNAYVKADKEAHLEILLRVPHGMNISDELMRELGVSSKRELALRLKKALYGLKQAGRLWSKLLHLKLMEAGFTQSITDMCLYYKREGTDLVVVGVYVDDLLVTATTQRAVDQFFVAMQSLSIKNLGEVSKFLGMRVELDDASGYTIDQEVAIDELLAAHGLADAHGVRTPIGDDCNDPASDEGDQLLPTVAPQGVPTLRGFQSLVGSLIWIARCTRPDISFAVHKATRQSHQPRVSDWKSAKRIARYLKGTKYMKLGMSEVAGTEHALDIASWSDADFAADKVDRKPVTGGVVTLNGVPVLWICKKQTGVSLSTMEAEFTSASQVARELLGLRELLQELELKLVSPMPMWVDNQAAIAQLEAERTTSRSKHIDIRLKFVCDFSRKGVVQAQYVESRLMIADLLTKALSAPRLAELRGLFNLKSCRMTMQQDDRQGQNCAVSEEEC